MDFASKIFTPWRNSYGAIMMSFRTHQVISGRSVKFSCGGPDFIIWLWDLNHFCHMTMGKPSFCGVPHFHPYHATQIVFVESHPNFGCRAWAIFFWCPLCEPQKSWQMDAHPRKNILLFLNSCLIVLTRFQGIRIFGLQTK